jgi:hypothetical protein
MVLKFHQKLKHVEELFHLMKKNMEICFWKMKVIFLVEIKERKK